MIKSFRELEKMMSAERKKRKIKRDGDRAVAEMTVRDDSAFLSPYSMGEHEVVASEVADFIESALQSIPPKEELKLEIHSNVIDGEERERYRRAIRNYYSDRYESSLAEKRKLHFISLIMAVIGIVALTAMIVLHIFEKNAVFNEIVDIFAWVFLWEAVDIFFLQCSLLRLKQKRYLALIHSVIEFYPLEEI